MAKTFQQMNKEELIKAVESFNLMDRVVETAKDPEKITNSEYVTVLEEFKASQDEINAETKKEIEDTQLDTLGDQTAPLIPGVDNTARVAVDQFERAKLKQVMYKYIVTDHQNSVQIEDDDETRTFPIQYGNLTTGPKNWNVGLHGNPQALPFSVASKLEDVLMTVHTKDGEGNPIVKSQPRFRVTKIEGWTQDEIDALKRAQNTRKFKN